MYQLPMSNHVAALLSFVFPSPTICWQRWAKEYFKKTKRRAKPVLLSQLLAIYGQEAKPVQAASNGQASHMVIVNVPDQARTIPPVVYNFIILYVPTIIQLLLLSEII
jgi:hypothetical protein